MCDISKGTTKQCLFSGTSCGTETMCDNFKNGQCTSSNFNGNAIATCSQPIAFTPGVGYAEVYYSDSTCSTAYGKAIHYPIQCILTGRTYEKITCTATGYKKFRCSDRDCSQNCIEIDSKPIAGNCEGNPLDGGSSKLFCTGSEPEVYTGPKTNGSASMYYISVMSLVYLIVSILVLV